jgi:uncharacterized flavoprotein (TIGR03862 family)
MSKTLVIIGGGPAGLMAAEVAIDAGLSVSVYEQMPSLGRKFLMAGRGGLNLSHSMASEPFMAQYGESGNWLRPMIEAFNPHALKTWSEGLGQPVFIGSSGRIFPESFKTSPLLRAWLRWLDEKGVSFHLKHRWLGWNEQGQLKFDHEGRDVVVQTDATVLALGGGSWAKLGSNGLWQEILQTNGVMVDPLEPSNMGFHVFWSEVLKERFAGQPIKNVDLKFEDQHSRGDLMITAEGIEGGAVYALSGTIRDSLVENKPVELLVDLRPDLDAESLQAKFEKLKKSLSLSNKLRRIGLSPPAIALLREQALASLSVGQLMALIKAVPLKITASQPIDRAISSAGGVRLDEVDENLMLKTVPSVFVAGEMLDWEAPTGGFLLQACFATGRKAGEGVVIFLA